MRNRISSSVVLALLAVSPLAAQGGGTMGGMRMGDPTNKASGSGQLPAGWMMRFDPVRAGMDAPKPTEVKVVTMGPGLHFTSGPAAIYYREVDAAKGEFSVSAKFSQSKSNTHEAMGLFIGGTNLQDATQNYTYFVIKPFEGSYQIKRRMSDASPARETPVVDAAVNKDDPTDGHATNEMTIHVAKDTVHFLLNGKLVRAVAKSTLGVTDGVVGIRINHNIDVHVDGFALKK